MKKTIILSALVLLAFNSFAQVEQHEVTVRNVVVPVRVLDGNQFVANLTIDDFELFESGEKQKIEALYLVRKSSIARKETAQEFNPFLSRHFYMLFQLTEYNPQLSQAIDYLFNSVILPGDTLTIMTPMNTYTLSQRSLKTRSMETISKELQNIVRKDTQMGGANYRSLISDLKRFAAGISASGAETSAMSGLESNSSTSMFGIENLLMRYQETVAKLDDLRIVDENQFIEFARRLKRLDGQKNVFFFYEREFKPEINQSILNRLLSLHQDEPEILAQVQNLFQLYQRNPSVNTQRIIAAFSDSSLTFNFLFMHKNPELISGITMREQSEDMFNSFSQVAHATGGITDSSQNPGPAFKNAVNLTESYYLLYYSPSDYKKDGTFKSIIVRLKDKNHMIIHRIGYIAD